MTSEGPETAKAERSQDTLFSFEKAVADAISAGHEPDMLKEILEEILQRVALPRSRSHAGSGGKKGA